MAKSNYERLREHRQRVSTHKAAMIRDATSGIGKCPGCSVTKPLELRYWVVLDLAKASDAGCEEGDVVCRSCATILGVMGDRQGEVHSAEAIREALKVARVGTRKYHLLVSESVASLLRGALQGVYAIAKSSEVRMEVAALLAQLA